MANIPRVLELLNEMDQELQRISESNPALAGVLDQLAAIVEDQRQELHQKKRFSYEDLSILIKFTVSLIDIVGEWTNTLYYKFCRSMATIVRGFQICQLGKVLSCSGFMPK